MIETSDAGSPVEHASHVWDACFVGGSVISLLYAHKLALQGQRVLVLEAGLEFGGAWKSTTVFGSKVTENAPHFLTTTDCAPYFREHFGEDIVVEMPMDRFLPWSSKFRILRGAQTERNFRLIQGLRGVIAAIRGRSIGRLKAALSEVLGAAFLRALQPIYFRGGVHVFVDRLVKTLQKMQSDLLLGSSVISITKEHSHYVSIFQMRCSNDAIYRAHNVYITRHSIVKNIEGIEVLEEDIKKRQRRVAFVMLDRQPVVPIYLMITYNGAPFSFLSNLSEIDKMENRWRGDNTVLSCMFQSEGFFEDFGGALIASDSSEDENNEVERPDDVVIEKLLCRLIESGVFPAGARILDIETQFVCDSSLSSNAIARIKSVYGGRGLVVLNTADLAHLVAEGLQSV